MRASCFGTRPAAGSAPIPAVRAERQTQRFTELADGPADGYVVTVRPEQVVDIAYDGGQRSPAAEVDTADTAREHSERNG